MDTGDEAPPPGMSTRPTPRKNTTRLWSVSGRRPSASAWSPPRRRPPRHDEAQEKAAAAFRESLRVGDILYSSWGWEQTNIDFYQVIAIRGSAVDLRQLDQRTTEDGYMCGTTVPLPDVFKGKTHTHRQQGCKSSSYKIYAQFCTQKSRNYNIFLDSSFRIFLPQQIAILSYK